MTPSLTGGVLPLVTVPDAGAAGERFRMSLFSAALPPGAAGSWCRISVRIPGPGLWWAKIEAADLGRGQVVREAFLGRLRIRRGTGCRSVMMHLPGASEGVELRVFSEGAGAPTLSLRPLGRRPAAFELLVRGWCRLPAALRGDRRGFFGRLRAILGQAPARAGETPPYDVWIDLFDRWGQREFDAFEDSKALDASRSAGGLVEIALVDDGGPEALSASLRSLPTQWRVHIIRSPADWAAPRGVWLLVLAAGEVLAPQAGPCFELAVRRMPGARGFCADLDHLDAAGRRVAPHFRPPPDPWLLRSGFFARGAWLFSRDAHREVWPGLPVHAGTARLALARAGSAETLPHLPLILTHCPYRPGTEAAAAMCRPVRPEPAPMVSLIIPSSCRSRHVLRCLRAVLRTTDYPRFEILLAVSSVDESDRTQAHILRRIAGLPQVRVVELAVPVFNYAGVNNKAAAHAKGDLLLLLNDDVAPISADWLSRMVAHACGKIVCGGDEPVADVVGARLLYGNGMVQHGGVIMGLANLCEHAFRLADRDACGPQGLARLDRRVAAVTAACMLVRRSLFESLGGLDEAFAIALNDVDFCLRAGEAGARVVLAAEVELYHFESLSLGRHYQGERAALEAIEVRRLRDRWAAAIAADPWYNPCASLEVGREFEPGFPPRLTPFSWIKAAREGLLF